MRDPFLDPPKRKQNRLQGYDYGRPGYYFITICANERAEFFWEASSVRSVGAACGRPLLSVIGLCVQEEIRNLTCVYDALTVDKYVIMPNHIHMILCIHSCANGRPQAAPTVEHAINQFKGAVSKKVGFSIWQRSYHDHIIRSEADYRRIWEYIDTNPAKWREDCYYCEARPSGGLAEGE